MVSKTALEHRVVQLEGLCQKLKERLKDRISKEDKKIANEREAYHRLKRQAASQESRSSCHCRATPILPIGFGSELKRADIFQFCEKRMHDLMTEMASLREQNRHYASQLRSVENEAIEYKRMESVMHLPADKLKVHSSN